MPNCLLLVLTLLEANIFRFDAVLVGRYITMTEMLDFVSHVDIFNSFSCSRGQLK